MMYCLPKSMLPLHRRLLYELPVTPLQGRARVLLVHMQENACTRYTNRINGRAHPGGG